MRSRSNARRSSLRTRRARTLPEGAGQVCENARMNVRKIDPRDIAYIEDQCIYRVYFSDREPDAPEIEAGSTFEWEISDADLEQVIDWINENRWDRAYSLYLYTESDQERILHHLVSKDRHGRPAMTKVDP